MQIRIIAAAETRFIRRDVLKPGLPDSEVHLDEDDQPSTFHLGAFDSDRLVGVVTFFSEPCPIDGDERDWRLRGMAVVASVRDRGVGGELLEAGIARVGTAGGRRVWCNGRTRARRFYERHGFEVVGAEFESPNTGPHYLFVRQLEVGNATP